jgi:hypothetical protein
VSRPVNTLLILLLIQCGIVTVIFWPSLKPLQTSSSAGLTDYDTASIDEIRVGDEYDNEALLVQADDQWLLPELANLPADSIKIEALLRGITSRASGWPVAHTLTTRRRFQVTDNYYQRKLTLLRQGIPLGTIYLGTSPGFQKVHARSQGRDAIFSIPFNTFDAPAINGPWIDPKVLQVRAPLSIYADGYSLRFDNGTWQSGTGSAPDEQELQALINALRTLQVDGVAPAHLQRELSSADADLVLEIYSLAGEETLELFSRNNEHFIFSNVYSHFFKLSAYDFDRLTQIDIGLISPEANMP